MINISIKLFVLILCLLINTFIYAESPPVKICLTGKVETTFPKYKIAIMNSANLAVINKLSIKNVSLKTYFFDSKPLSAIRAYKEMVNDHCSAIIGFEYLSDLLLVSKTQINNQIPIFTSYASSLDSDVFPKNIFIFMPSYDYQAKKMMDFIHKKTKALGKVLLITEVDRADLARYKTVYQALLNKDGVSYETFDFLQNDSQFESNLKKFIANKHYNIVFVFSGAVGSTKIINYMNDHRIVFIGTEDFGSSTNQSVYTRLNDKVVNAYTIRNIDFLKKTNDLSSFEKDYERHYSDKPNALAAYTYDAMNIILNTFARYHSVNASNILITKYVGITGAYIHDNAFHRSSQYVILSIEEKGFHLCK